MEREERVEIVSAILTAAHIINTQKSEENFPEIMQLYFKYHANLDKNLPQTK